MTTGLKFYPKSHRYKLDGAWVQGVTTILGNAIPKPGLTKWSARMVAEYVARERETVEKLWQMGEASMVAALKEVPWTYRDAKAERGKEVHALASRYVAGEPVEVPDDLVGHVESAAAFMEDWDVEPVLTEAAVGSRSHQYAGTLDLIADHNRGPRAIFDYKTGGIYESVAFQNTAYAFADFAGTDGDETPLDDLGVEASWAVQVRADGYDVHPLEFGADVFREFLHLKEATDILKRATGDWRVKGTGYVGAAVQTTTITQESA